MCHIYQHNHTHFVATYVLPTPSSPITSVHEYIQHQMHILLKPNFTWRKACKFSTLAQLLKIALNSSMVDPVRGMMHPRLYSVVDLGFSILSAFTGPIKTILRLLLGFACLALHLFRVDVSLMLDKRFVKFDLHYRLYLVKLV